jgi:speckle-type POZ protein
VLRIEGYARTKMMLANGQYVCSGEFQVGGHTWHLRYYPNGHRPETASYISMHLLSTSIGATEEAVHGKVKLSLPGPGGELVPLCTYHNGHNRCTFTKQDNTISFDRYVARDQLEKSSYLKDDCFSVRCDLTVFVKEVRPLAEPLVEVPPPVLPHHLCQLLSSQERSDVSFKVGRKTFAAHRCVLSARSLVFKAELLGPMREHEASCIRIDDMDAAVFRAFLHFIYTDELPTMTEDEVTTMAQHLLVAADRYCMERLKLACEDKLCRHLDMSTAATTLALAEQHHCPRLKEAIFAFLCSSTANLRAVVASDGYEHLTSSCPSITKELVAKLAAVL